METAEITKEAMTTISVKKSTAEKLRGRAKKWGDTYDTVIEALLNGNFPEEEHKPQGD